MGRPAAPGLRSLTTLTSFSRSDVPGQCPLFPVRCHGLRPVAPSPAINLSSACSPGDIPSSDLIPPLAAWSRQFFWKHWLAGGAIDDPDFFVSSHMRPHLGACRIPVYSPLALVLLGCPAWLVLRPAASVVPVGGPRRYGRGHIVRHTGRCPWDCCPVPLLGAPPCGSDGPLSQRHHHHRGPYPRVNPNPAV